jgi:hypothetical protein
VNPHSVVIRSGSLKSKISSAFGLVALHEKNYREAAHRFTECQVEIGAVYNEVCRLNSIFSLFSVSI